jgi:hypothetical protein
MSSMTTYTFSRVENTLLSLVWHHWQQNWILVIGYRSGVHLIAQIRDPKSAHAMIWHPICTIPMYVFRMDNDEMD